MTGVAMSKALTEEQWKPIRERALNLTLNKMAECVVTNPTTKVKGTGRSPAQAFADYQSKADAK